MSNGTNTAIITDLLKWGFSYAADEIEAARILKAHNVDPDVYAGVIADHRKFDSFHGANPQGSGIGDTLPTDPQPTDPTKFAGPEIPAPIEGYDIYRRADGLYTYWPHGIGPLPEGHVPVTFPIV